MYKMYLRYVNIYVDFYIKRRYYVIDHPLEEFMLEVVVVNEHKSLPFEIHFIGIISKMKV